jgi:hypothetical protein
MKKVLLILLIFAISFQSVLADCGQGFIELKKQGQRDWVKNYDDLFKRYISNNALKVSSLKVFFYDTVGKDKPKTCISIKDLHGLNANIQKVFSSINENPVKDFKAAIKAVTNENPLGQTKTAPTVTPATQETDPKIGANSNDSIKILTQQITTLEKEKKDLESDQELLQSSNSLWKWFFVILLLLSVASITWLIQDFRNRLKEKEKSHSSFKQEQMPFYENQIKELKETIKELKEATKSNELYQKNTSEPPKSVAEKIPDTPKPITEKVSDSPKPQEKLKQFYLSSPISSADGKSIFDGSEMYNANSNNSLYVFNLLNDNKAEFKFFSTPNTVQDAIKLPDRFLLNACEYSSVNSSATKIITTKVGIAIKEGNNWKITQKAEIRFE